MSVSAEGPAGTSGAAKSGSSGVWLMVVVLTAILAGAYFVIYPIFILKVLCFALFAAAVNLLLGFGGMLSFGHAAFFGSAAYTTAHLAKTYSLPPELSILAGVATATALALVFGALVVRRQGVYLAMITLALAQIVYFVCLQSAFTGGEDGIQAVPRGSFLGFVDLRSTGALYVFVSAAVVLAFLFIHRVVNSPFGEVIRSIRQNEARATSLGYDVIRYKYALFVLTGALAGLAGSLKTIVFQLATLSDVHWSTSGAAVLMVLIGGMGTMSGPLLGALVIVAVENYLAHLGAWVTFVQGWIFIATVLVFRKGIVGTVADLSDRMRQGQDR